MPIYISFLTSAQLDLAQHQISHLENRENDLFYENRELRDLVSVLATRMFRFSRYCRRMNLRSGTPRMEQKDDEEEEEEETSLDGSEDRFGQVDSDEEFSSDEDDIEGNLVNCESQTSKNILLCYEFLS